MKTPCEKIVKDILPSLRAEIVKELDNVGMSQAEIGRVMGITRSSVNQYLKRVRGTKKLDKKIGAAIKKLAREIVQQNKKLETCDVCNAITNKRCGWCK